MRKTIFVTSMLVLGMAGSAVAQKLPGKGIDACTVVAKAEIEKMFGVSLADGKMAPNLQTPGQKSICDFGVRPGGQIRVLIRHDSTPLVAGPEKAAAKGSGTNLRYVKGLGDTAYFMDAGPAGTVLTVFRGGHEMILVSALAAGAAEKVSPPVEKLARLVTERWK